jgi:hypothetical protein
MPCSTLALQMCIIRRLFASFLLKLIYCDVPYMKAHQNVPKNLKDISNSSIDSLCKVTPKINWGKKLMKIVYKQQYSRRFLSYGI